MQVLRFAIRGGHTVQLQVLATSAAAIKKQHYAPLILSVNVSAVADVGSTCTDERILVICMLFASLENFVQE